MKKTMKLTALFLAVIMAVSLLASCGAAPDALSGTWKQTDEVNGDWTWTFDGGKCKLVGDTTGFESEGTYVLDESKKTVTVNLEGWDAEKVYNYTLSGDKLDLEETYSSYHLVKQ